MAPFGKVHAAMHNAGDRIKSGLAWANHRYQQGVGLAQRVNEYMHVGRKVAGLMMPVLDRMHPELAPKLNAGIGASRGWSVRPPGPILVWFAYLRATTQNHIFSARKTEASPTGPPRVWAARTLRGGPMGFSHSPHAPKNAGGVPVG